MNNISVYLFFLFAFNTIVLYHTEASATTLSSTHINRQTSSEPFCFYNTFTNTRTFDPPSLGGSCRCPNLSAGISFTVDRGQFSCMKKCYEQLSKTNCTTSMKENSQKIFSSCCTDTCYGKTNPSMKFRDLRHKKNGTNFGCAAVSTSPSPTPVFCPYQTFANEKSYDPPVLGGFCRCTNLFGDRFTPGISFPVSRTLFSCTSKCISPLSGTDCKADMKTVSTKKLNECCVFCRGSPLVMTFFEQRTDTIHEALGCLAPPDLQEEIPDSEDLPPSDGSIGIRFSEEVNARYVADELEMELNSIDSDISVLTIPKATLDGFLLTYGNQSSTFYTLAELNSEDNIRFSSNQHFSVQKNSLQKQIRTQKTTCGGGSCGIVVKVITYKENRWRTINAAFTELGIPKEKKKDFSSVYVTNRSKIIVTKLKKKKPFEYSVFVPFTEEYKKRTVF